MGSQSSWLHMAAASGEEGKIRDLLRSKVDVNSTSSYLGRTALQIAVYANYYEIAKLLLKSGADVNFRSEENFTALYMAVMNNSVKLVKLLLKCGAEVNPKIRYNGRSPLYYAVERNCPKVAKMLLKHGASINDSSDDGRTVLDLAQDLRDENFAVMLMMYAKKQKSSKAGKRQERKQEPLLRTVLNRNFCEKVNSYIKKVQKR